jgi:hypothetical protein
LIERHFKRFATLSANTGRHQVGLISQKTKLAEASAMLCQWERLAFFVGGGGVELLEAPLS